MADKKELEQFVEDHKNELVLDGFSVVRLLDFDEDPDDYYYVLVDPRKGKYHLSCACGITVLKGAVTEKDYDHLEHLWKYNVPSEFEELENPFEEFERKYGSIELLKATTSALTRLLISKNLCTKKEMVDTGLEVLKSQENDLIHGKRPE
jgi:hypothetical protein